MAFCLSVFSLKSEFRILNVATSFCGRDHFENAPRVEADIIYTVKKMPFKKCPDTLDMVLFCYNSTVNADFHSVEFSERPGNLFTTENVALILNRMLRA